jgi:TetR/AcrR family transcriptional regulator, regulator of cefoperazone and chloramphenicol sensitivity
MSMLHPTKNAGPAHAVAPDAETYDRLLEAAARLFAARGFKDVTVREICRAARANVASVNYYFGDKAGLYREVLKKAIDTMRATTDHARQAGEQGSAEQKLRAYVRIFLHRAAAQGRDAWIQQLMMREMADPTPALDLVFDQLVRLRLAYVAEIVSEMIGRPATDEVVLRCVLSIQSQCHAATPNSLSKRLLPEAAADPNALDRLADHIADFSLAGLRAVERHPA